MRPQIKVEYNCDEEQRGHQLTITSKETMYSLEKYNRNAKQMETEYV